MRKWLKKTKEKRSKVYMWKRREVGRNRWEGREEKGKTREKKREGEDTTGKKEG